MVVFPGQDRLIGRFIQVTIEEATAVTLFGSVVTGEHVGVEQNEVGSTWPASAQRVSLPLL
jgi:hypothetical protein